MAYYTAFAIVAVTVCVGMSIPLKMNRAGLFTQDAKVPAITATQLRKRQLSYQALDAQAEKYGEPEPAPDCRLVCVSKFPTATYSGMLPGTLAGQFSEKEMQIDLTRLTQQCGAQLILDEVTGIDWAQRNLHFASTTPVAFDVISIGVGSVPAGLTGVQSGRLDSYIASVNSCISRFWPIDRNSFPL